MPAEYGCWLTLYKRHHRWSTDGTWSALVDALRAGCDEAEGADWTVGADSSVVRAHQHAAGARRQPPAKVAAEVAAKAAVEVVAPLSRHTGGDGQEFGCCAGPAGAGTLPRRPDHQDLPDRRPAVLAGRLTSPGQHGDSPQFIPLIEAIRIRRRGPGRPRSRPARVLAGKAYSSQGNHSYLRGRGIKTVIPVKDDQHANRRRGGSAGGRPPAFHRDRYTQRNTVERAINKLKSFRAVATRYDKLERIH